MTAGGEMHSTFNASQARVRSYPCPDHFSGETLLGTINALRIPQRQAFLKEVPPGFVLGRRCDTLFPRMVHSGEPTRNDA